MSAVDFNELIYNYTEKQLTALHHYVVNGSKLEAYRFAYDVENMKEKTIQTKTWELWRQPHMKAALALIQKAAKQRQTEMLEKISIDAAWVLERTALLANFNIKAFIKIDEAGQAYYDFSTATDNDWYCISEYTVDVIEKGKGDDKLYVDRVKVKTTDKLRALELVGRHISVQAFKDQLASTNTHMVTNLNREEFVAARKEMLENDEC